MLDGHYSKSAIKKKITDLLPEALHDIFQVNIKTIPYFKDKRTYTRGYVLEMDRETSKTNAATFFDKLNPASGLTLVPYNSGHDIDNTIQNYFFQQNVMLKEFISLRIDNLFGITMMQITSQQHSQNSFNNLTVMESNCFIISASSTSAE